MSQVRSFGEPHDPSVGRLPLLLLLTEEARLHGHVHHEAGEAKFWLDPGLFALAQTYGLSLARLRTALRSIQEHADEIRAAWQTHFSS
jgi:hypothetical protein